MHTKLIEKGLVDIKKGEINSAIATFKESIKLFPKNASGHFYLANLYSIKDKKTQAVEEFNMAWKYGNNLQKYFRNIPHQILFVLLSMDTQPKEEIGEWIERAKEYYEEYATEEKIMIDFAKRIISKEKKKID